MFVLRNLKKYVDYVSIDIFIKRVIIMFFVLNFVKSYVSII